MSRINGEKARAAITAKRRAAMRLKSRAAKAAFLNASGTLFCA